MERTFVMVKNDGVSKKVIGDVISRFENNGFKLIQCKVLVPTMEILNAHYAEHTSKPWFKEMADSMCASEVVPMVWERENAVAKAREIIGATNPKDAAKGTIRADHGTSIDMNVVHGADSVESAEREITIWFSKDIAKSS
ncbi:nucleoside-diphosphate kinase [Enteropsectra breve]|nr:nucleoside-diphosphate kinase [Enteropsectra breve]